MRIVLITIFICSTFSNILAAQEASVAENQISTMQELEATRSALEGASQEVARLRALQPQKINEKAQAALDGYHDSWVDFYSHEKKLRKHSRWVLLWQLISSYVLLILVVSVTGLGVFLSYFEVRSAITAPEKAVEAIAKGSQSPAGDQPIPAQATELILSLQKLQVTSAVTGVVILVLSLGFLYLFVARVFELNPQDFSSGTVPVDEQVIPEDSNNESKSVGGASG